MIEVKDISWKIRGMAILSEVSLSIVPGKVTALLGPNGSGKSSLIRIISGATEPSEGFVSINKTPLQDWGTRALARCRSVLNQETHLDFDFSVNEVVMLGRSPFIEDTERQIDHDLTAESIARMDITYLSERAYPPLSGGEKQRVQIARVLNQILETSKNPRYLILDEPLNNLDPKHAHQVLQVIRSLASEGVGICMVVHDLNLALQYADNAVLLNKGRNIASGNCYEILTSPAAADAFQVDLEIIKDSKDFPVLVTKPKVFE